MNLEFLVCFLIHSVFLRVIYIYHLPWICPTPNITFHFVLLSFAVFLQTSFVLSSFLVVLYDLFEKCLCRFIMEIRFQPSLILLNHIKYFIITAVVKLCYSLLCREFLILFSGLETALVHFRPVKFICSAIWWFYCVTAQFPYHSTPTN